MFLSKKGEGRPKLGFSSSGHGDHESVPGILVLGSYAKMPGRKRRPVRWVLRATVAVTVVLVFPLMVWLARDWRPDTSGQDLWDFSLVLHHRTARSSSQAGDELPQRVPSSPASPQAREGGAAPSNKDAVGHSPFHTLPASRDDARLTSATAQEPGPKTSGDNSPEDLLKELLAKAEAKEQLTKEQPKSPSTWVPVEVIPEEPLVLAPAPAQEIPEEEQIYISPLEQAVFDNPNITEQVKNNPDRTPLAFPIPDGTLYLPQNPEIVPPGGKRRPRRVVLNYARGCCAQSQQNNCKTAIRFGADMCIAYTEHALSAEFRARNSDTLSQSRGGGYWLWKPYLAYKVLSDLDDGDMVMVSDAGQDFGKSVVPLFDFTAGNDQSVMLGWGWEPNTFKRGFLNRDFTRRDTFLLTGCTDEEKCANWWQLQASLVAFQKTEAGLALIGKWLTYLQDPRATTDMANSLGQADYVQNVRHRHDQSVLSLIAIMQNITGLHAYCCDGLEFSTVDHHRQHS